MILSVTGDTKQAPVREADGSIPDRLNLPGQDVGPFAPKEPTHRREEVSLGDEQIRALGHDTTSAAHPSGLSRAIRRVSPESALTAH